MKRSIFAATALLSMNMAFAAEGSHFDWSYAAQTAPDKWSQLKPEYQACAGMNQAPINIAQTTPAQLPPLKLNYAAKAKTIVNNQHTVQVNFEQGNHLELDQKVFELKQFHLHSPSENTIQGQNFAMEMHLVHATPAGELAVLAIMFQEGQENPKLKQLWQELPQQAGEAITLNHQDVAAAFLPEQRDYYRFNGSLTTPPCTEGVRWIVFKQIQQASRQQIQAFSQLMEHPNNRPVQPTNARLVLE